MPHIKIPDVAPIVRYVADGIETSFVFPFPIFATEDLKLSLDGAQKISGFTINGAGDTAGGSVVFDTAPPENAVVTIQRELSIERISDFLEGGDFSATSINNELDYIIAALQQVNRDNDGALRFADGESVSNVELPAKKIRQNKALGFDGDGNPVAVSLAGSLAAPDYTAVGTGAATRTSSDKFSDMVSVKDFGAVGDGLTDDTVAIQNTIAAHSNILIPNGTFLVSSTIEIGEQQSLIGLGQRSILKAINTSFNVIDVTGSYGLVQNIRIEGGDVGLRLYGKTSPCVQNGIVDVVIVAANTGVQLDGYNDTNHPCYWNNFDRVLVLHPAVNGFHLVRTGGGDTPNANKFHACRAYSLGADISNAGFYVEHGSFNNSFIDCEANVKGTAQGCFIIGAGSDKTLLMNPYAESNNQVPNIKLENGSIETAIYNLLSVSDGAAIFDLSGGNYTAYNSGFPEKNTLGKTVINDLKATLMRYDTEFIDTAGTTAIDLSHTIHLVNATNGAITIELPAAADAAATEIHIKKVDNTSNIVTILENGGAGPDGKPLLLGGPYDYATLISNGAAWYIKSSNRTSGNTRFHDGSGTYDIDMAVDVYLVSSFGGALTTRLPPANAVEAIGRMVTIKKTDVSANVVTVSEQGGSGPDGFNQPLAAQYNAITVVSNGAQWHIVSKF